MKHKYYVSQLDESDCGVAALAMILRYYGSIYSIAKLRSLARTTKQGTTAFGIVQAAKNVNLIPSAFKTDMSLFKSNVHYPFIAHLIKQGTLHYCVVFGADSNDILVADPDPNIKVHKVHKKDFANEWSGVCLFFSPAKNYVPVNENAQGLASSFCNLRKQGGIITTIVIFSFFIACIGALNSYFIQLIIDRFIPKKSTNILLLASLILLFIYAINAILNYIRDILLIRLGQGISSSISLKFIKHVFRLPMDFFATRRTGEITSRFNDINKITDAISNTVISVFLDLGIMLTIGAILAFYSTRLFLITLVFIPVFTIIIYTFNKKFAQLNLQQMESNAVLNSTIIENLRGIETLKSLCIEKYSFKKIKKEFSDFLSKNLIYSKAKASQNSLKLWAQYTLATIVLYQGTFLVINKQLSLGNLVAYNTLLIFFLNPLQNIVGLQIKLQEAKAANNRLNEILVIDTEESDKSTTKKKVADTNIKIEFQNVDYSYEYNHQILSNIDLLIEPHSKNVIVGKSGSGKSTLVKLIVNFFNPTSGSILINDKKISSIPRNYLRKEIMYIPQTPHLFSGSIKANLLLGFNKSVSKSEIDNACKKALIYDDIQQMPLGYNTHLEEEGENLSGGQKQRLVIARALLSPAKVLILDESTSSLDVITEKQIINNLLDIQNKTIIFISHNISTAKLINNIIVMSNGKIIEKGTHEDLINNHSLYYKMSNL